MGGAIHVYNNKTGGDSRDKSWTPDISTFILKLYLARKGKNNRHIYTHAHTVASSCVGLPKHYGVPVTPITQFFK